MDLSVIIISSIACALIYVFIIKPRQDKKAAEAKKKQEETDAVNADIRNVKQVDTTVKNEPRKEEKTDRDLSAPDLSTTNSVVWMAHCINHDIFVPRHENMAINASILSLLNDFEKAVKAGDKESTNRIYNNLQGMMMKKLGNQINHPMTKALMLDFKICALSKDLLDLYKMVIEGQKDEDVLSGKGSIRRILKYSIELGSPVNTLDTLTDYFVNNTWFDNMPEEIEWHKLALECMMVTGNGELGNKIFELLQKDGGISEEEKEELFDHAREFRSQIDDSWM